MKKSNFALRLQPSLLEEARRTAEEEGVALNQLINVAVAEKLSALRTQAFFRERARRANVPEAIEILKVESHSSLTSDRKRGKKNTQVRMSPVSAKNLARRTL
jgi:hypothetical protein